MAHKLAIQELTRGYELVKKLQSQLESSSDHHRGVHNSLHVDDAAANLSEGVLETLTVALSLVKPSSSETDRKSGEEGVKRSTAVDQHRRFQKRGKKEMNSWTTVTPAPYLDDYQWRKYGQKNIQNAKHPRTYYRCTHSSDQGCPATKQVQQQNDQHSNESPMYLVICNNQHTCITTTKIPAPEFILESPAALTKEESGSSFWIFEPKRSNPKLFTNVIKEDQQYYFTPSTPKEEIMSAGDDQEDDICARSTAPAPDMDGCLLSPNYHISNSYGSEFDEELESLINSFM